MMITSVLNTCSKPSKNTSRLNLRKPIATHSVKPGLFNKSTENCSDLYKVSSFFRFKNIAISEGVVEGYQNKDVVSHESIANYINPLFLFSFNMIENKSFLSAYQFYKRYGVSSLKNLSTTLSKISNLTYLSTRIGFSKNLPLAEFSLGGGVSYKFERAFSDKLENKKRIAIFDRYFTDFITDNRSTRYVKNNINTDLTNNSKKEKDIFNYKFLSSSQNFSINNSFAFDNNFRWPNGHSDFAVSHKRYRHLTRVQFDSESRVSLYSKRRIKQFALEQEDIVEGNNSRAVEQANSQMHITKLDMTYAPSSSSQVTSTVPQASPPVAPVAAPNIDIARLSDDVMKQIDKRIRIERQRQGLL